MTYAPVSTDPADVAMTDEHMVRANGVDLCTQAFGSSADPVVLLVMGSNASMLRSREDICRLLAAGGRFVIRYDHRDTGRSTAFPPYQPPYVVADLVRDALGVLDAYGVDRAHVFGFSLGGVIVEQLAVGAAR